MTNDISIEALEAMESEAMVDFSVSDAIKTSTISYNAKMVDITAKIEEGDIEYIENERNSPEFDDVLVWDPYGALSRCIDKDRYEMFVYLITNFRDKVRMAQFADTLLCNAISNNKKNFIAYLMDIPESNPLSDITLRSLVHQNWGNARKLVDGAIGVIDMIIRHPKVSSLDIAELKQRLEVDLYASNVAEDGKGDINDALQMIKVKLLEDAWGMLDD